MASFGRNENRILYVRSEYLDHASYIHIKPITSLCQPQIQYDRAPVIAVG